MCKYLILQHPGHNRVYYKNSDKLALAELKIALSRTSYNCIGLEVSILKGIRYISFSSVKELSTADFDIISRLSFVFAIYKLNNSETPTLLEPIEKVEYEYVAQKISSIQKYAGKTNELFTKMMINVGLLSSDFNYDTKVELLDPVAGKGTTLFEGLVYGFNATGVEFEQKSVHFTQVFFKKYLEEEKYKHEVSNKQVDGKSKADGIFAQTFEFAKTKAEFKTKEERKKLEMVNGNSQNIGSYFKSQQFHLIVGDLPYGIAHGNTTGAKNTSITRNPSELIETCLEGWVKVLKTGGALVLAWNAFVISRKKLQIFFENSGLKVLVDEPYNEFEHMVDKSIKRDIIVAIKE